MHEYRVDLDGDHPAGPGQKMRGQRAFSRSDLDRRVSLRWARNLGDAYEHTLASEEMLAEAATQTTILPLSFYFNVAGIVERNPYGTGDRLAESGGGPELGEQQAILDAAAQLLGLARRTDDGI